MVFIARSAYGEHHPSGNESLGVLRNTLMTREHADKLKELSVERIRKAADDSSLINCPVLDLILIWWQEIKEDNEEVRSRVSNVIRKEDIVPLN